MKNKYWRCSEKRSKEPKSLLAERNSLSSCGFLKSFVTNHGTWPHYFSLMSCHTWQKCDTDDARRRSVSNGSFPSAPSRKTHFTGCTCREGGREAVGWAGPRSKTLSPHKPEWKRRDAHKTSGFTRFVLSPSLTDETERPRVLFLPAVKWQKVRRQDEEWENRKKAYFFPAVATFSLSVMVANQNCNFYGACRLMSFHLFSFILFVVARLWKLKAKACDSCWEWNCHKLPLLTRWWITFISASPLI